MTKLYIDTNILIYAIEDSNNFKGQDISSSSSKLFWEAVSCKFEIIISSWTIAELERIRKIDKFSMFLKLIKKKLTVIRYSKEEMARAKSQNPNHFQDELHGILALKSNADYIVTRNISDFFHYKDRIKIAKPEKLIESNSF